MFRDPRSLYGFPHHARSPFITFPQPLQWGLNEMFVAPLSIFPLNRFSASGHALMPLIDAETTSRI